MLKMRDEGRVDGRSVSLFSAKGMGVAAIALAVTNLSVLFDIPVLREVLGFVFVTFVPGLLTLHILRLNRIGATTRVVLAVGLSVAFAMLFGAGLSGLLTAIGYAAPLSVPSLLISFDIAVILLTVAAYARNRDITLSFSGFRLTVTEKAFLVVPALLPVMSILGMRLMNASDNNVVLVVMLLLIAGYIVFVSVNHRRAPSRVYPAALFLIGISLLLMYSLRSNYIIGSDEHRELYIFQTTLDNLRWSELGFGTLDVCLSISVLPAVYQGFTGIAPEILYKMLYSMILAFAPLAVYVLARKYLGDLYAFLAACLFISQVYFLWTPSATRTNLAIFFFTLSVMVLFNNDTGALGKRALLTIFMAAIIASHYGTTYIVFILLTLGWVVMRMVSRWGSALAPAEARSKFRLKGGIAATFLGLFAAMIFLWYGQMTGPTFGQGVRFIQLTIVGLATEARGDLAVAATGGTLASSGLPQRMEFALTWLMILLVGVGVLAVVLKYRRMVIIPGLGRSRPDFLRHKIEAEYLVLAMIASLLLAAALVVPHLSRYYGLTRLFFQMMALLAVFACIGGDVVARFLRIKWRHGIIVAVVVPYLLSTTGLLGLPFGYDRSITLSSRGTLYESIYVHDEDSYAAQWLGSSAVEGPQMFVEGFTREVLISQGMVPGYSVSGARIELLSPGLGEASGYVYLRKLDIAMDVASKYRATVGGKRQVYANGGALVYY